MQLRISRIAFSCEQSCKLRGVIRHLGSAYRSRFSPRYLHFWDLQLQYSASHRTSAAIGAIISLLTLSRGLDRIVWKQNDSTASPTEVSEFHRRHDRRQMLDPRHPENRVIGKKDAMHSRCSCSRVVQSFLKVASRPASC